MKINDPVRKSIESKARCMCGHLKSEHAFGEDAKTAGGHVCLHIPECGCPKFVQFVKNPKPVLSSKKRDVATETTKVTTGNSAAFSSKKCVYYHDVPPALYRRSALRSTGGHTKYNDDPIPITMNLNWRAGLDDPLYMMDRLNHMFEHMVTFLDEGNTKDDNLGAIALMAGWLMECEEKYPDVFNQLWGQTCYAGKAAVKKRKELQEWMKAWVKKHDNP